MQIPPIQIYFEQNENVRNSKNSLFPTQMRTAEFSLCREIIIFFMAHSGSNLFLNNSRIQNSKLLKITR